MYIFLYWTVSDCLVFSADSDVRTWLRTFPELVDHQLVNVCCMKKLLESMIATNPSLSASVFEGSNWIAR